MLANSFAISAAKPASFLLPETGPNSSVFLSAAHRIAVLLCRDAVWAGDRCNWLTWAMDPARGFSLCYRASNRGLYDGTAGIGLFLAELYKFAPEPEIKMTLEGVARLLLEYGRPNDALLNNGFYSGLLGIAFTIVRIAEVLKHEDWLKAGLAMAERAASTPSTIPNLNDILCGHAGLVSPLLDLSSRFNQPRLLSLAKDAATKLAANAVHGDRGVSWAGPDEGASHLLGYSHGNAGMALALLELDHAIPSPELKRVADLALAHERSHYDEAVCNWPDFRSRPGAPATQKNYSIAWCHGAPGIGLSRLRLLALSPDDPRLLQEIEAALKTSANHLSAPKDPPSSDFSYCHGLAGSAELLIDLGIQLVRPDLLEAARAVGCFGLENYAKTEWPCGVRGAGEVPGLMMGTAGIGYFLLRLHAPKEVASMLVVRPKSG